MQSVFTSNCGFESKIVGSKALTSLSHLGQSLQTNEDDRPGEWPVERSIFTDWGAPSPGVPIFRFFDHDTDNEINMECLVAGFDHAGSSMTWEAHACGRGTIVCNNPDDRTRLVYDFIAHPQAEVPCGHAMRLVYALE